SVALGVPTIWQGLIAAAQQSGSKLESLKRNVVGGSACPPAMLKVFKEQFDCETIHAWGMTETSPLGSANQIKTKHLNLSEEEWLTVSLSQGRPPIGVDRRLPEEEKGPKELARHRTTLRNLQTTGHWIIAHYRGKEESALTTAGWFDTTAIATVNEYGFM